MTDNYWSMGVPGPGGPCSRDLLRPRPGVRPGGRAGRRRGPLPGDLEPGLHAVRARARSAPRRTSTILGDAAAPEHRHRPGPRAGRLPAAGRRQPVRDRRGLPGHRPGRRAGRQAVRRSEPDDVDDVRLRVVADHVRSAADAHRRRRHARQRGPRLRAAPPAAPRRPHDAPARRRGPGAAELLPISRTRWRRRTRSWPPTSAASRRSPTPRRRPSGDPERRHHDPRHRGQRDQGRPAAATLLRRAGLPAARHLRLPDRPHPGDGRRAGPVGRRGRLPPADERAARAGQGRRARPRRPATPTCPRTARSLDSRRHRRASPATTRSSPRRACVGLLVDGVVACPAAPQGDEVELVLDRTPFYAEGGGQLADQGTIRLDDGAVIEVDDVQTPCPGSIVHRGRVASGEVAVGDAGAQRRSTSSAAGRSPAPTPPPTWCTRRFRDALGETATQAGSENAPGPLPLRLRVAGAVPPSRPARRRAGGQRGARRRPRRPRRGHDAGRGARRPARWRCSARSTATRCASSRSATGPASCAAARTRSSSGQLGLVKLLGESSIGAGVRRVEALVGVDAYNFLAREHALVGQLTELLKVRPEELPDGSPR